MKIEKLSPKNLVTYSNNARTHDEEQISQIMGSIKEFGFTNPLLIDEDNRLIAGHGRLLAAQHMELETVPCIRLVGLSEAQKIACSLADNKISLNAGWSSELLRIEIQTLKELDFDLDVIGFSHSELDDLFLANPTEGLTDPDDAPELPKCATTQIGDIWVMDKHRLMCGDSAKSEDVERLVIEDLNIIFTDPPYGVSYADKNAFLNKNNKGNRVETPIESDHLSLKECAEMWGNVFSVWHKKVRQESSFYVCSSPGDKEFHLYLQLKENGFNPHQYLVWNKNNHVLGRSDFNYKHECILYGWTKSHTFYGKGPHKSSVWEIDKPHISKLHPTMKPVELIENALLHSSLSGDICGDMFAGSGSTLIACEKKQRVCYCMEIDPHYCDVVVQRWEEYTGKQATLEKTGHTFEHVKNGRKEKGRTSSLSD